MAIDKYIKVVADCISISIITMAATCNKRLDCFNTIYSFDTYTKAYPDKEIINLSDTLWFELEEPAILKDKNTGRTIDYSGAANLGTDINYDELLGNNNLLSCADCFNTLLVSGTFIPDDLNAQRNRDYKFVETNGTYLFKIGVIPKKKGTFMLSVGDAANVFRDKDKCTKASFLITFKETNQHLYLYEQNKPMYELSQYEKTHLYCFQVQ